MILTPAGGPRGLEKEAETRSPKNAEKLIGMPTPLGTTFWAFRRVRGGPCKDRAPQHVPRNSSTRRKHQDQRQHQTVEGIRHVPHASGTFSNQFRGPLESQNQGFRMEGVSFLRKQPRAHQRRPEPHFKPPCRPQTARRPDDALPEQFRVSLGPLWVPAGASESHPRREKRGTPKNKEKPQKTSRYFDPF